MDGEQSSEQDPLALGGINERRLVAAFLDFLKIKSQKTETTAPVRENLDVARQCLTQAFELTDERIEILRPQMSLMDIFASHPNAAPVDPKKVLESELNRTPAATAEDKAKAEEFKNKGNDLMKANQIDEALHEYTQALTLDPTNPILYCNRAAAYSKLNQHDLAAKDCEIALAFDSNYAKAYGRYGLALHGLGMLKEAKEALEKAVSLDGENQLYKNNLKLVEDAIASSAGEDQQGAGGFPGFPGMPGAGGGLPGGMFDMLQNPDFQSSMMNMMQNPQVQQMINQFSGMFMNQMAQGGPGAAPGAGGLPPAMNDLFQGGLAGLQSMTPEQIAAQMQGLFQQPPAGGAPDTRPPGSQNPPKGPEDKKDPPPPPSYFS